MKQIQRPIEDKFKHTTGTASSSSPQKPEVIIDADVISFWERVMKAVWGFVKKNPIPTTILSIITSVAIWLQFSKGAHRTPTTTKINTNGFEEIVGAINELGGLIRNRVPDMRPTTGVNPGVAPIGESGLPVDITGGISPTPPVPALTTNALKSIRVERSKGVTEIHTDAAGNKITYHDCVDINLWPGQQLLVTRSLEEHITFHHIPGSGEEYFVQYQKEDGSLSKQFSFGDKGNEVFDNGVRTATNFIITPKMDEVVKVGIKYLPK